MRTAFEFARLLFALDPWSDPHGAIMHLEFLAVKADQREWFLELEETWEKLRAERSFILPLDSRPGWVWSKSLILRGTTTKRGGGEVKSPLKINLC